MYPSSVISTVGIPTRTRSYLISEAASGKFSVRASARGPFTSTTLGPGIERTAPIKQILSHISLNARQALALLFGTFHISGVINNGCPIVSSAVGTKLPSRSTRCISVHGGATGHDG